MSSGKAHIAVIGAGIVGVSTACMLAEKGFSVTVLDPQDPGEGGASRDNAAQIFPSLIYPLPSPEVIMRSPRLLMDPMSPLSIPLSYALPLLPWLAEFARASTPSRFKRGVAALTDLNRHAYECFESLLKRANAEQELKKTGAIQLYESEKTLLKGMAIWEKVPSSHSGGTKLLDKDAVHELIPHLGPTIAGGILLPNTGVLSDPLKVVRILANYARTLGVQFIRSSVDHVHPDGDAVNLTFTDQQKNLFDKVVVAAGVWSRKITEELAEPQRIDAERGYNLTVPNCEPALSHALVFAERGVVATQLSSGLRLGGWDELGGITRKPNPGLFAKMELLAAELLPGFDWTKGKRWMGLRPSLPDGLPVIGQSKKHSNVYYAFGHGHLGMTLGAITGLAIANMIAGEVAPFDLTPFAVR